MPMKKLVLVESPAKAKTIQKFVDKTMIVRPTFGHIRDLPKSKLGVSVEDDFEPNYIIPKKASAVVKELKQLAKQADDIYLATDPDREGEAIAWHVVEALNLDKDRVHRILFHEITQHAIQHALDHPGKINDDLVDAQQARRVLDRLVGYSLSPLLWKKIYRGLSAGRVQSVALRLITERETAIGAFKEQEYWSLWSTFVTNKKESILAKLEKMSGKALPKLPSKKLIDEAQSATEAAKAWVVVDRITEEKQRHPKPPFTTSTLQQEASRKLHYSVKQTMMYAQKLYEGIALEKGQSVGLITYMRTDSLNLAETAIQDARATIESLYGATFVPKEVRRYRTKAKGAQEAHEAVRPTDFGRTPDKVKAHLTPQEYKLYKLIWERAIASQMASATLEATQLHVGIAEDPDKLTYVARGQRIVSPGFLKVYREGTDDMPEQDKETDEGDESQLLPLVHQKDTLTRESVEAKQHFTQPPPRFTEASLVKEMEKLGIGRPSTYAPTIATLVDRGYVTKEEHKFTPTQVGTVVIDLLKEKFPSIVDYDFTAQMEEKLDGIAEGDKAWQKVIQEFYKPFHALVEQVAKEVDNKSLSEEATDEQCPLCQKPLIIKLGRYGKFFACTGFPECRFTKPVEAEGVGESPVNPLLEGRKCPQDGGDLLMKNGRFGTFIACANYPACRYIESILKETGIICPKDKGSVVERRSKRGKLFWGCANYPKCDFVLWDKPSKDPCPSCGGIMVYKKKEQACSVCGHTTPLPETES